MAEVLYHAAGWIVIVAFIVTPLYIISEIGRGDG